MLKMASKILLIAILGAYFISATAAKNVTRCYVCSSPWQRECDDEFDIVAGEPLVCSDLHYDRGSNRNLLDAVMQSERLSNTTSIQFVCVKVGILYANSTPGITRTCYKQAENIANPCDFIREEVVNGQVTSCHFCTEDYCNTASGIYASIFMIFTLFLISKNC